MVKKVNNLGGRSISSTMHTLNNEIQQLKSTLNAINVENLDLKKNLRTKSDEITSLKNEKNVVVGNDLKEIEKKLVKWYELIEKEVNKNEALANENNELINKISLIHAENERLQEIVEDVKHHLSYTIGKTIVDLKPNLQDIFLMPKNLFNSYKKYYDYKLIKKHSIRSNKKLNGTVTKNVSLSYLPLRYGEKEIFLDSDYLNVSKSIKASISSVKLGAVSSIKCEIVLKNGTAEIFDKVINKKIKLDQNKSHVINFSVSEGKVVELFEVIAFSADIQLQVKWSKVSGKALLLKLNDEISGNIQQENNESKKLQYTIPLKPSTHLLLNASEILDKFGKDAALDFFDKYSSKKNSHTIHILRANIFHENKKIWLEELNNYLAKYNLEKIGLNDNDKEGRYFAIDSKLPKTQDNKTLVTVIMPAFNAEKTILKSINSILNQTWGNLELIVVNDCSTDSTKQIIESIKDSRLKIIHNIENVGAYVSKNIALKYAKGMYITGHDADDWAHPKRIENHMKEIEKNNKPRASLTKMIRMDKNGYFSHIGKEGTFSEDGALRIASITCMFERDFLINKLGAWDSVRMGADSEIIARAKMLLGDEFKTFNLLSMICLDAEGSLTNDPIHGVSKVTGISQTRKVYRDSWLKWHGGLTPNSTEIKLNFPLVDRPYEVPEAMDVNLNNVLRNLK